jgi:hypothetical protein
MPWKLAGGAYETAAASGLLSSSRMSAESFDSGSVFSRARPVLTFSPVPPQRAQSPRGRDAPPTQSAVSLHEAARGNELPVIARIVRRPSALEAASPLLSLLRRAQSGVRRSGVGTMVITGLALATLGTIASFGMRSLAEPSSVASAAVFDAKGTERVLSRGALAPRTEQASPKIATSTPAPTRAPVAPSAPPHATTRPAAHASLAPLVKPGKPSRATVVYARR